MFQRGGKGFANTLKKSVPALDCEIGVKLGHKWYCDDVISELMILYHENSV